MSVFDHWRTQRPARKARHNDPAAPSHQDGGAHGGAPHHQQPEPHTPPGDAAQRQRQVLDGLPAAIALFEWAADGRFVLVYGNPALFRLTGRNPSDVVGKTLHQAGVPEAAAIQAFADQAISADAPLTREVDFGRDGRIVPLRVTVTPQFDESGRAVSAILAAVDLSQQRAAEAQAEGLARQLRAAAEVNPDSFQVMEPVRDGAGRVVDFKITFENAAARALRISYSGQAEAAALSDMVAQGNGKLASTLASYIAALESGQPREDSFSTARLGQDRWYHRTLVPLGNSIIVTYRETTEQIREVEALALAEADKNAILDGLADLVLVADLARDGSYRISYANQAYYSFFGQAPAQVIGKRGDELDTGGLRQAFLAASGSAAGRSLDVEVSGDVRGQQRHLQIHVTPIVDDGGSVVRRIWRGTDVTELREFSGMLQQRESHYESILNGLADLICVSEPAEDGEFRITYANPAYLEFMGLSAAEVLNKPRGSFQRPELYDLYEGLRQEAIALGGPVARDLATEINGRMRYGQVLLTPVFDDAGECVRAIWRITDLTGQRESEAELDRAEAREQAILDGLSDLVYVLDRDAAGEFRFTHANRAVYESGDPASLLGKRMQDLLAPDKAAARLELLQRCVRERRPVSGEFTLDFEGRRLVLDIRATPVIGDDGTINRVIWRATDLTDRRASENLFRAAATANLDPFSHLEPVYDASGAAVDFAFKYSNAAWLDLNRRYGGTDRTERLGELFASYPAAFATELKTYMGVLRDGRPVEQEYRTVDIDGQTRWLFRQIVPVEGGVIISGRDITERKQRDEEMARAEALQRLILEGLNDAIVLSELDRDGCWRVLYANRAFLGYRHLSPDEVVGKTTGGYLPPDVAERIDALRAEAIAAGAPAERELVSLVDGLERRRMTRITPIFDSAGQCVRTIARSTDITERRELESRFEAAAEANLDGFMIFTPARDAGGTITDFDVTFANGVARKGVLSYSGGRPADRLSEMFRVVPGGFPRVLAQYVAVVDSGVASQDETVSNADGSDRWFQRQLIPFSGGLVVTYREVTETRRAQLAIETAERNHRAILEGLADAVVVSDRDADGNYPITYANPAFFRMLGIPPAEVVAHGVAAFLPPEIAKAVVETRLAAIAAGAPIEREIGGNVRGRNLDLVARIMPVFDDAGACIRLIWRLNDVGESRRQQRAIEQAGANQRAILENLTDGIVVCDRDLDGVFRLSFMHPVPSMADAYPPEKFIGKTWQQVFNDERAQERLRLQEQAIASSASVDFELQMDDGSGRVAHLLGRVTPVLDPEGPCSRVIWRYTDVTGAYEHQRHIEADERNQRAILESLQDGILVFDRANESEVFRVSYSKPLRALRDRYTEIVGYSFADLWPDHRLAERRELARQAMEKRGPVEFETTVLASDGTIIHELCLLTPVFDESGGCTRLVWRFTDVTEAYEQRRAVEAAERNQRAILSSLTDAIVVADRDDGGRLRITYANQSHGRVVGDGTAGIIGAYLDEHAAPSTLQAVHRAIESREPQDFEQLRRLGEIERELAVRVTPVFDEDGICVRIILRYAEQTDAVRHRREIEAAESNQRAILDALSDVLIVMDRDATGEFAVSYINAAREALTGRPDDQLLGKRINEFVAPVSAAQLARAIEHAVGKRRTVDFDGVTADRNDELLFYSARITPTYQEDGSCNRIILRYSDVTAERRARARYEESERNREAIVENLADIVLLFDRDESGDFRLSYANAPFFATGRTPEETANARFRDFLAPEEALQREAMLAEALTSGAPVERELTVDVRGRVFHYTTRISPVFDTDDATVCRRAVWRYTDITELVRHRERLAASERDQRAIVEGLSDALLVADRTGDGRWQVVQANSAHYAMSGQPAGSAGGRYLDELAAGSADPAGTLDCVLRAVAARQPVDLEVEQAGAGADTAVFLSRRATPLFDAAGNCYRVIVRTTDVTSQRRHHAVVNRLGRMLDSASDEIYIVDVASYAILQMNAGARRNLGLSESEARGISVGDLIATPDLETLAPIIEPLVTGQASRLTVEAQLRRKDGSVYPVEAEIQYLPDEQPPVVLAIARDVSERRALQDSLSRMAAIVESSADAVIGLDPGCHVTHWNPAARSLFGYASSEVLGLPLSRVFRGDRWDGDGLEGVARAGGKVDTSLPHRDGHEIDVALSAFPVHDPAGRALGTAIIAHDIRARLEATAALRESELRFRSLFDQAPSGILVQRATDGVIVDINPYLLELVDYERDAVVGRRPIELGLVEDPAVVIDLDNALRTGLRTPPRELTVLGRTGRRIEMLTIVESIELNGERCFLSFLSDISHVRQAERELLRAQERLLTITQNLPLILTSWDERDVCTLATGHGLEAVGLLPETLLGRHMSEIIGPAGRLDAAVAAAAPGDSGTLEFSLAGRIFESQYRVLPDGSGTVSVALDITEQRATLGQIDAVVENAPITLFAMNADGVITIARGRGDDLLGFAPHSAIGRSAFELFAEDGQVAVDLRRVLGGERFSASYHTVTSRYVDVHYSPVRAVDGALAGATSVIIDVTERVNAERAIQESNERFRQIAETASDGIVSVGTDSRIAFANEALGAIFGYSLPELIGQPLTLLMPHELASAHRQGFRRYLDSGQKVLNWNALELTGRRRDGSDFQMEMSLSEGVHDGERVVSAFIRDITERRRTEEALMQAQKLESLGVLAGGIAHDFNNMLVAIMGNAGLALAELPGESPARETVQEIELAARRAAELARQMLAYSGKGRLAVSRVDLTALVREIPHLLRTSIGKGVNLRYDLAERMAAVEADATQLRQVVMNLVINASDAIGEREGVIAISTGVVDANSAYLASTFVPGELKPGQYCYLEIADTGSGMAPETLARIFDPFFTTKFTGKGLGLAAVLGIVRGHRGTIKVDSVPGQGTTFRMLLPAAHGVVHVPPPPAAAGDRWRGAGQVLVVDDEESVRHVTARAVRAMGFEAVLAVDGQDGVEQFTALHGQLSCVLMDLTMPRLNGEAAAARMRAIDADVPIVLMSGFDQGEMATRFRAAGVAGFVQKPFEIRTLRETIRAATARRR